MTYITYTHTCMYAFMHTYIDFHTYVPTYLYTHIPPYLCIYIPLYLYLYLYTYVPAYIHCIALHYITVHYITYMYEYVHTYIVGGCMHCGCTATLDTWTDYANLVEYVAETNSEFREISLFHTKRIFDLYILSLSVHVNII